MLRLFILMIIVIISLTIISLLLFLITNISDIIKLIKLYRNKEDNLKIGDRVAFGGRPYDIWIVESIDKENNWCVVISDKYPKAKYGGYIDI